MSEQDTAVAWVEGPHGAIRANPAYKFTGPTTLNWSIPLYTRQAPPVALTDEELADCGLLSELSPPVAEPPRLSDAELERLTGEPHIDGWPLYSGLPPAPELSVLEQIDLKAQAGLCYFTLESARAFLQDIRKIISAATQGSKT